MEKAFLPPFAPQVALPWIIRLRYAMAAGQMVTAGGVDQLLHIELPLGWIAIAPLIMIVTNVWLGSSIDRAVEEKLIAWVFVLDALCLTATLMLTGGPNNPFSLLYLVHITLSATILTRKQTWALGALSIGCFGSLFLWYRPIAVLEMHHHGEGVNLHLFGMWAGFGVASLLVAMFSGKISELLRDREESLLRMQAELARKDRLASLATLAAGAAHELNTPLGTIAIAAKELERYATRTADDSAVADDSRLIRREVERCREILQRMSASGAEAAGESFTNVTARSLGQAAVGRFQGVQFESSESPDAALSVPKHAVQQAIEAMLKNALDASGSAVEVKLSILPEGHIVRFLVSDRGPGMSADTLRHVGEPFFTTKEPGKGMGLGIFLVRTLAERLGGEFDLESVEGEGTRASLILPIAGSADVAAAALS